MARWTCEACDRSFGRTNQTHVCEPAMSLNAFLATQREVLRPIYMSVVDVVSKLDGVDAEPVEVGILVRNHRQFVELRPKRDAVELTVKLSRELSSPRVRRSVAMGRHRHAHFIHLTSVDEVDNEIEGWIIEAYED